MGKMINMKFPLYTDVMHVATGKKYVILAYGKLEATQQDIVVYGQAIERYENVWVRPLEEFYDGRFVITNQEK